jgi:hypothetical protein
MAVMVLAPECLLGKALVDLLSATFSAEVMKAWVERDGIEWTLTHAYFANMGGFALKFNIEENPNDLQKSGDVENKDGDDRDSEPSRSVGTQDHENTPTENPNKKMASHTLSTHEKDGQSDSPEPERNDIIYGNSANQVRTGKIQPSQLKGKERKNEEDIKGSKEAICTCESVCKPQSLGKPEPSPETSLQSPSIHPGMLESNGDRQLKERTNTSDSKSSLKDLLGIGLISPSRHLGQEIWSRDPVNQALVTQAMDTLSHELVSFALRQQQRNLLALQGSVWILDAAQLNLARSLGLVQRLPMIHEQDLDDQNKGDALVKALAVVQSCWLIVQLLVRHLKHLPSSQLELVAGSYACCSIFPYLLYWFKPKDVLTPKYIAAARYPTIEEIIRVAREGPTTFFQYRRSYWMPNNGVHGVQCSKNQSYSTELTYSRIIFMIGSAIGSVIFGGLHLFAWNFTFPTNIERLLWRIASLLFVSLSLLMIGITVVISTLRKNKAGGLREPRPHQKNSLIGIQIIVMFFVVLYALIRLFIIAEVIRSLFYLPPMVFASTWASSVPHVA